MIAAWRCAVCGETVDISTPLVWACPNRTVDDPRHVLHPVVVGPTEPAATEPNPFVRYRSRSAWWAFATANGMTDAAAAALAAGVAEGFTITPFERSEPVSAALGCDVWIKDETRNVGGSHKARHLVSTMLHLRAAELLGVTPWASDGDRPPLAIASCGNAAIAAATLAHSQQWPIEVLVPDWADGVVTGTLAALGATVTVCPRTGEPGDRTVDAFRRSVGSGSIPFGVQGPDNATCLDGGRTIGWELSDAGAPLDAVVIQVGGGALASCVAAGIGPEVRLDTVQADGCAPLARAWEASASIPDAELGRHWAELMWPWDDPRSVATGILDDETYDWIATVEAMRVSNGEPLVVTDAQIVEAAHLAARTAIAVSATGSAGLAGVVARPDRYAGECVGVVFSGVAR